MLRARLIPVFGACLVGALGSALARDWTEEDFQQKDYLHRPLFVVMSNDVAQANEVVGEVLFHRVEKGDTFLDLARYYGLGANEMDEANPGVNAWTPPPTLDWKRSALSAVLCLTYGGALLGSGIPYWRLTTAFLFLHIVLLDETTDVPARLNLRRIVTAAILAPAFATAVTLIFQYIFLVRLP